MELQHHSFDNAGCEVHYWLRPGVGKGYVILLHGAGCDHRMFEAQLPVFGEDVNLLLWDARGHGQSPLAPGARFRFEDMLEDLLRLFEIHGIDDAVLVGQSMGGNLAQEILYRRPELVSRLVLIDCTRNTGRLTSSEKLMLRLSGPIFSAYPWKSLIRSSADACGNTPAVKQYVRECFERMEKAAFLDVMMSLMTCLHEDQAYRFAKPVLLLCGVDDKSGNIRKIAAAWAGSEPNCTLCMIENAGHNANQDNPEAVNLAMREFLFSA